MMLALLMPLLCVFSRIGHVSSQPAPVRNLGPDEPAQECTYTISVSSSQLQASCGGQQIVAELQQVRQENVDLRAQVQEMQQQILFLVKEFEGMVSTVQTVRQETASWREVVAWPNYEPAFRPEEVQQIAEGKTSLDCFPAVKKSKGKEGIYGIKPYKSKRGFLAYCDSDGWLVLLRRFDGSVDFDRNWSDYSGGFGELTGEYWLGLEHIHLLTSGSRNYELAMEGVGYNSKVYTANYDNFEVGDELQGYNLTSITNMTSGNLEDEMADLLGLQFSARDRDNDNWYGGHCAEYYHGGWWQDNCGFAPTRRYCSGGGCMGWGDVTLKKVLLKVRPMSAKGVNITKKPPRKNRKPNKRTG